MSEDTLLPNIEIAEPLKAIDEVQADVVRQPTAPKKARVTIVLEENDEIPPTGQFFGVNGVGYILRPGEAAEVPAELLETLDHAITSVPVLDQRTLKVISWKNKLRFPYRVVIAADESRRGT